MNALELTAFADRLADDLTIDPAAVGPEAPPDAAGLADFLDRARPVDDDRTVLAIVAAAIALKNTVDHLLARAAATMERTSLPQRKRLRTVGAVLTGLGMAPSAAYRTARLGAALTSTAAVSRGMRDGAVSAEMGDAVIRGLAHIDQRTIVTEQLRDQVISSLMVQTTPAKVDQKARAWAHRLAPDDPSDTAVPPAEDLALNEMTVHQGQDGRIEARLDLDVLSGEELNAALDPLCRPIPEPDGSPDTRSAGQRRADAFTQIVRTYLSHSERPLSGGVLPHATLLVPARLTSPGPAADASTATGSSGPPGGQTTASAPTPAGAVVQIPLADVDQEVTRVAEFGFTGPTSVAMAELLMCEASVAVALLDDDGLPLNVGREHRLFTPGQRKALAIRDRGCAFPGCGLPPSWCDAHHMKHWAHGGATDLVNGVLLCRRHHGFIHTLGWEVFAGPDQYPWFLPPPDPAHPDRYREPICANARRTLTNLPTAA
ncbi:hypothetical protein GOHSU_28_00350 [Gordonia hirsuta DSM 44140 = NBRC 16056]|uniref:HNH nuclease domain-containing protein n=1 Tax=Gordonia hirsuta DSM 44140 = NBRC 16056 TaxID=1121927 RepID=L7LA37_9ACTN|nr:HNH endonuclease signature motif containing protein [Gordonia hirsuta]GAC57980.1 hypothetical protein GOHSU_28_00350 [Gordonia hirsuta DSM 44140 = NBRC 16056]